MTADEDCPAEWLDQLNRYRGIDGETDLKTLTTVTFEEQDGGTKLTIRTRFASAADRDAWRKMGATEGWAQSLERLEALLARV